MIQSSSTDEDRTERKYELCRNRHAGKHSEDYRREVEVGDEIMKSLREGDSLVVQACAMFPGWENFVEEAGMEVWSLDDLGMEG